MIRTIPAAPRRQRLRPAYFPSELPKIYPRPHDHRQFPDHLLRVDATIAMGQWMIRDLRDPKVGDLSTGDATIPCGIVGSNNLYLGDYAPGYQFTGPIEQTIRDFPRVDLFVCSETVEHLDDPDTVLSRIRKRADRLVLSTPANEWTDDNPEHYWGWNTAAVEQMLVLTGWNPVALQLVSFTSYPYEFQIWGCA